MSLLIHSLSELDDLIMKSLEIAGSSTVTEIGAEGGDMTRKLLAYAQAHGGWLTSIDPAPSVAAEALLRSTPFGVLCRDISLHAIPTNPPTDVYIVDGDHNYFTVLQELLWIERVQTNAKKPLFAILHDVGWPWAYRDLYYNPEAIPEECRQPYTWNRGVTLDDPGTVDGGFRGCGSWACAEHEGGERNGVLKAAEDFVAAREGSVEFALVPAVFGLGIVYSASAPWKSALEKFLQPFNRNPLLAKLERNRLENYLRVIELQDLNSREDERLTTNAC